MLGYKDVVLRKISLSSIGGEKIMFGTLVNFLSPYCPVEYLNTFLLMVQSGEKVDSIKYIREAMSLSLWQAQKFYEMTCQVLNEEV